MWTAGTGSTVNVIPYQGDGPKTYVDIYIGRYSRSAAGVTELYTYVDISICQGRVTGTYVDIHICTYVNKLSDGDIHIYR